MNDHLLPITFSLDQDCPIGTLEAVLAVARRGNVRLVSLRLHGNAVALEVDADERDWLHLFGARLHNVIGVHALAWPDRSEPPA